MKLLVGVSIVISSVIFGYAAVGGHLHVLWQPFEFLIIMGAAVGAFLIANPKELIEKVPKTLKKIARPTYSKSDYLDLLSLLFTVFKIIKSKGIIAIESHLDKPQESDLFQNFPVFLSNTQSVQFLCDYLRMMTMGSNNPQQMDALMEEEVEGVKLEAQHMSSAFFTMADGTPALGIVAAVLGVIHTMGSITQPPEILGKLIGGALVGTFFGVLLSYGFISPIASAIQSTYESDIRYIQCLKSGVLAFLNGLPPLVAVECARKRVESDHRPSFLELEESISKIGEV